MNHRHASHHHVAALTVSLLLAAVSLTVPSCSDNSCYDNGSSLPKAECYVDGAKQSISGLTIKGIGAPGDSLLADSSSISEIYLPLRASVSTTSYELHRWVQIDDVRGIAYDTLTIDYEPIVYFHSTECGAMYNFKIKKVACTSNAIDSVTVLTPTVTNSLRAALRIHFTDFDQ